MVDIFQFDYRKDDGFTQNFAPRTLSKLKIQSEDSSVSNISIFRCLQYVILIPLDWAFPFYYFIIRFYFRPDLFSRRATQVYSAAGAKDSSRTETYAFSLN